MARKDDSWKRWLHERNWKQLWNIRKGGRREKSEFYVVLAHGSVKIVDVEGSQGIA